MDPSAGAMTYNWQPTANQWPPNPEVRYSGGVPIMFESGTKGQPLPSIMYGCPYPPSADGKCNVSPFFNRFALSPWESTLNDLCALGKCAEAAQESYKQGQLQYHHSGET